MNEIRCGQIGHLVRNPFCLIITITISVLFATVIYTISIYKVLMYICLFWGIVLVIEDALVKKMYRRTKQCVFFIVFVVFSIITIFININNNAIANTVVIMYCIVYFFIYYSLDIEKEKEYIESEIYCISRIIVVFTFITSAISLVLLATGTHTTYSWGGADYPIGFTWRDVADYGRVFMLTGLRQNSIIATSAATSIIFSLFLLNNNIRKKNKKIYVILIFNIVMQYVCISLSDSITVFFAMLAATVVWVFFVCYNYGYVFFDRISKRFINKNINKTSLFIISFSISLAAVLLSVLIIRGGQDLIFSLVKYLNESNSVAGREVTQSLTTATGRYAIWELGIDLWKEHPLFGLGSQNISVIVEYPTKDVLYTNMHNGYLCLLIANGIMGFIPIALWLVIFIFCVLKRFFSRNKADINAITLFSGMALMCVINLAQDGFLLQRGIVIVTLLICMRYLRYYLK